MPSPRTPTRAPTSWTRPWSPRPGACAPCGCRWRCSGATARRAGGGGRALGLGRAARRHGAQRGGRADRRTARDRLRAGPPGGHPSFHLRLRTGRGPRGPRDRADDRRVGALRRRGRRSTGCSIRGPSITSAVAVAALVGFAGNEWVARYRIRVGRAIGSAALVADGLHARTDGFTSLAVLLGAGGSALGWRLADPVVGLAITAPSRWCCGTRPARCSGG